jgi:hypothetical protein
MTMSPLRHLVTSVCKLPPELLLVQANSFRVILRWKHHQPLAFGTSIALIRATGRDEEASVKDRKSVGMVHKLLPVVHPFVNPIQHGGARWAAVLDFIPFNRGGTVFVARESQAAKWRSNAEYGPSEDTETLVAL